jgi:DNA (cytosine-5)-methyltransferase 1
MLRVIDEVRPTWVIGENVAGITTMVESCEITDMGCEASLFEEDNGVHRFRAEYAFTIERICRDLESKGYSVQPMLIPACAIGAPHRRDRVFIIAHNTDCRNDLREPGKNESGEKWLSERNSVWELGESDNVRSEIQELVENPMLDGCESGHPKEQGSERNIGNSCSRNSERVYREERTDSSYSDSWRGSEMDKHLQSELTDGAEPFCNGRIRDAADSVSERLERQDESRSSEGGERMHIRRDFAGCGGTHGEGLRPEERWRNFPTVSPVHRGNDGIPFDVDSLTISFSKWRNESIKAYGNAIVPQAMYRIFQCIEKTEQVETR